MGAIVSGHFCCTTTLFMSEGTNYAMDYAHPTNPLSYAARIIRERGEIFSGHARPAGPLVRRHSIATDLQYLQTTSPNAINSADRLKSLELQSSVCNSTRKRKSSLCCPVVGRKGPPEKRRLSMHEDNLQVHSIYQSVPYRAPYTDDPSYTYSNQTDRSIPSHSHSAQNPTDLYGQIDFYVHDPSPRDYQPSQQNSQISYSQMASDISQHSPFSEEAISDEILLESYDGNLYAYETNDFYCDSEQNSFHPSNSPFTSNSTQQEQIYTNSPPVNNHFSGEYSSPGSELFGNQMSLPEMPIGNSASPREIFSTSSWHDNTQQMKKQESKVIDRSKEEYTVSTFTTNPREGLKRVAEGTEKSSEKKKGLKWTNVTARVTMKYTNENIQKRQPKKG